MESNDLTLSKARKFLAVFAPALLLTLNLHLFTPFSIYLGNFSDFQPSLYSLLRSGAATGAGLLFACVIIGILLPDTIHRLFVSLLFIVAGLTWLQENILVWDIGLLGKGDIDWSKGAWRGWIDGVIWVGFLVLSMFLFRKVYSIARSASTALVVLQTLLLGYSSYQHPEVWRHGINDAPPPEALFEFSSGQNVIHVILDELQSDVFHGIISRDTAHYHKVFDGFTYFEETSGSFPTTLMSVPAILSGETYRNDVPMATFIDSIYRGRTLPNVLSERGFEVDLTSTLEPYGAGKSTNWYCIPVPYGRSLDIYSKANESLISDLVAVRSVPWIFKRYFLGGNPAIATADFSRVESYEGLRHFSNEDFLQDMIDRMSVGRNKPLYKLIHLTTTHYPAVVNARCENAGVILPWTWENIRTQAKCSLDHFTQFLERLKAIGVYDRALIIVQADHGYWKIPHSAAEVSLRNATTEGGQAFRDEEIFAERVCASAPLLAIKPPGSRGFTISSAQAALTDVPRTISNLLHLDLHFGGRSVFSIDPQETRERRFAYYSELPHSGDDYFALIDEYRIRGPLRDRASWSFAARQLPPGISYATEEIDLGADSSAHFLRSGWSFKEQDPDNRDLTYVWAIGRISTLSLSLPNSRVQLCARVKSIFRSGEQSVVVAVDGKEVGGWKNSAVGEWETHSVEVPADPRRPVVSTIEFTFSRFRPPDQKEARRLALLFDSVTLEEPPK